MKKLISIIIVLVMSIGLVACGGEKPVETTIPTEVAIVEPTEPTAYTLKDWQYYVETGDAQSESMGRYFVAMHQLWLGKEKIFNDFLQDPEPAVTEAFIAELNALNAYYDEMETIYFGTRNGEERYLDVTLQDYLCMEAWYGDGNGIEPPALTTIRYGQKWCNDSPSFEYIGGKWVTTDLTGMRYADGRLEIDDYYCWVVWHDDNVSVPEHQEDDVIYNEQEQTFLLLPDAHDRRYYDIIDSTQNSYFLLYGLEDGLRMFCIEAIEG